jgi:hypothetical protein
MLLETKLEESKIAKSHIMQAINDFIDFINGKELWERGGAEFEAQLKLFMNSVDRFADEEVDPEGDSPRQDGTSSSEDSDNPPVAQGSWVPVSNGQNSSPPAAHSPVGTAVDSTGARTPEQGWTGNDVSDTEGNKLGGVEELTLPRRANASFPVGSPAPAPHRSPARVAGPAVSAARFSAQALPMNSQGVGEQSFASLLEQTVWQNGKPYPVIRIPGQATPIGSPILSVQTQAPTLESMSDVDRQSVSSRYASQRVRDREIWGTGPPSVPDAYQNRVDERSHVGGEHARYHAHHGGPQFSYARAGNQEIGGQRQGGTAAFQEQEEFLGPREVAVYLSDRGVHLNYSVGTAAVEIDPNDFRGSFNLFANGRRTPSDSGSGFQRSPSCPAPLQAIHPYAARAAETVHPQSINTLLTDMTATGSTDTGSYSANLCPAIPIGLWSQQRPGKALVNVDVDVFIQGLVPPNEYLGPPRMCRGLV